MAKNPPTPAPKKPPAANPIANPKAGAAGSGKGPCPNCQKVFDLARLAKHLEICQHATLNKRPKFDAGLHRVKGTQLEKYYKKRNPP